MFRKSSFPRKNAGRPRSPVGATIVMAALLATSLVLPPAAYAATSFVDVSNASGLDLSGVGQSVNQLLGGLGITTAPSDVTPSPNTTSEQSAAQSGAAGGWGGYANAGNASASLPLDLGSADVGLSSGEINSAGNIVPDWPGSPQDESKATAAGVVEPVGIRIAGIPVSIGSIGSSAPPATGLVGRVADLTVPGIGRVQVGYATSNSSSSSTDNSGTLLLLNVEALDLDLVIPIGQSSSSSSRSGSKVSSESSSALVGGTDGGPLTIGEGLVDGEDALALELLSASSESSANGTSASNSNSWTLADLTAIGIPVLVVDSESGAELGGASVIPLSDGKSLLAIDNVAGLAGIYVGETWSESDSKSYAFGGANVIRVSLLDDESFLVLGHAGTGANAVSPTGPGAGPDQETEGPDGSNIPPSEVSPPNDIPTGGGTPDEGIGPGPNPNPNPNPNPQPKPENPPTPNPFGPGNPRSPGTPNLTSPPPSDNPVPEMAQRVFAQMLPTTGAGMLIWLLLVAGTLISTAVYIHKWASRDQSAV